jgi:hypothetical protein
MMALTQVRPIQYPYKTYAIGRGIAKGLTSAMNTFAQTMQYAQQKSYENKIRSQKVLDSIDLNQLTKSQQDQMAGLIEAFEDEMTNVSMNNKGLWKGKFSNQNLIDFKRKFNDLQSLFTTYQQNNQVAAQAKKMVQENPDDYVIDPDAWDVYTKTGMITKELAKPAPITGEQYFNKTGVDMDRFVKEDIEYNGYDKSKVTSYDIPNNYLRGHVDGIIYGEKLSQKQRRAGIDLELGWGENRNMDMKKRYLGAAILSESPSLSDQDVVMRIEDMFRNNTIPTKMRLKANALYEYDRLSNEYKAKREGLGKDVSLMREQRIKAEEAKKPSKAKNAITWDSSDSITGVGGKTGEGYVIKGNVDIPVDLAKKITGERIRQDKFVSFDVKNVFADGTVQGDIKIDSEREISEEQYDELTPSKKQNVRIEEGDPETTFVIGDRKYTKDELVNAYNKERISSLLDKANESKKGSVIVGKEKLIGDKYKVDVVKPPEKDKKYYISEKGKTIPVEVNIGDIKSQIQAKPGGDQLMWDYKKRFGEIKQTPAEELRSKDKEGEKVTYLLNGVEYTEEELKNAGWTDEDLAKLK